MRHSATVKLSPFSSTVAPAAGRALGSSILQLNSSSKGWGACEGRRDDQFERAGDAVPQTEYL